ncbi:MAG: hypothetical protein PHO02_04500 [Candidatus Nanoarchaeia archaeon]|nr:hypothetical protein [Candidatus Nanoarchaeia archaeon]
MGIINKETGYRLKRGDKVKAVGVYIKLPRQITVGKNEKVIYLKEGFGFYPKAGIHFFNWTGPILDYIGECIQERKSNFSSNEVRDFLIKTGRYNDICHPLDSNFLVKLDSNEFNARINSTLSSFKGAGLRRSLNNRTGKNYNQHELPLSIKQTAKNNWEIIQLEEYKPELKS